MNKKEAIYDYEYKWKRNFSKHYIGEHTGMLTIIGEGPALIEPGKQAFRTWLCKCDCGNPEVKIIRDSHIGKTISCGCYWGKRMTESHKKFNEYNLDGEYGIGYGSTGGEFYFDLEDYDKIKNYCWRITNGGYVVTYIQDNEKPKNLFLHQVVVGRQVDHINGNKIDNRKCNLRKPETDEEHSFQSYNTKNVGIRKDNTSGRTGVYYRKETGKWRALIGVDWKIIQLGHYDTKEEAIKAREEAEEKYFGDYSYKRSQEIAKEFAIKEEIK